LTAPEAINVKKDAPGEHAPCGLLTSSTDVLLVCGFCGVLFFYGLASFGLVGADEPRYAQVAREMLARHDWITPTLGGSPWLEKPPLYYWQAMLAYAIFGVSDWAARLPSAVDATLAVLAVGWFARRFGLASLRDGSLLLASSVGFIGFARAAATDMPLAATFTISMLAWFLWRQESRRGNLAVFYIFAALGMLAKGPVAPFLAGAVILVLTGISQDWKSLLRTIWLPGILVFLLIAMPWYIAVQVRNPSFFRVFILEHNLARFGSNLYHHPEPFWYYMPVTLVGLMPWAVFAVLAIGSAARKLMRRRKEESGENSLTLFLLVWLVVPVLFFSLSKSKLPGYILPAIPAGILLVTGYVKRHTEAAGRILRLPIVLHSVLSGLLVVPALMLPNLLLHRHLVWGAAAEISFGAAAVLAIVLLLLLRSRWALSSLRICTMIPLLIALVVAIRIGTPRLDSILSARQVAVELRRLAPEPLPIAVYRVSRETEYGLGFYINQSISRYESGEKPAGPHILIARSGLELDVLRQTLDRRVAHLGSFPDQKLEYYLISPAPQ
jgi:4-amino-4-deoxy-L-arabinose transferase-like glycosyltransferase